MLHHHSGYRFGFSVLVGGCVALLHWYYLVPSPPEGLSASARFFVVESHAGWLLLWLFVMTAPFRGYWCRLDVTYQTAQTLMSLVKLGLVGAFVLPVAWMFSEGVLENKTEIAYVGRALLPVVLSIIPSTLLLTWDWLKSTLWFAEHTSGRGSAAAWGGIFDAFAKRVRMPFGQLPPTAGLIEGMTRPKETWFRIPVQSTGNSNRLVIGTAGSGKSARELWPQLVTQTDCIKIIVDCKPEHGAMTASANSPHRPPAGMEGRTRVTRKLPDGEVITWNPYDVPPLKGICINPLDEIDLRSTTAMLQLAAISHGCVLDPPASSNADPFWVEVPRLLIEGGIIELKTGGYPREHQNLRHLSRLLAGLDPATGLPMFDPETGEPSTFLLTNFCHRMMENQSHHGDHCKKAAAAFLGLGERARGNVFIEVTRALAWCSDPAYDRAFASSEVDLNWILESDTPKTFYLSVLMGAYTQNPRPVRVLIQLLLRKIELRQNRKLPVYFFCDEAAQMLKGFSWLKEALVTLRAAGCRLCIYLQYFHQLDEKLGQGTSDAFETTSNIVGFGLGSDTCREFFSKRLGKRVKKERRGYLPNGDVKHREEVALMSQKDIKNVLQQESPYKILLPSNGKPLFLETLAFKPMKIGRRRYGSWPLKGAFDEHLVRTGGFAPSLPPIDPRIGIVEPEEPQREVAPPRITINGQPTTQDARELPNPVVHIRPPAPPKITFGKNREED